MLVKEKEQSYAEYLKSLLTDNCSQRELIEQEIYNLDSLLFDTFIKHKKKCAYLLVDDAKSSGVCYDGENCYILEEVMTAIHKYLTKEGFNFYYLKAQDTMNIVSVKVTLFDNEGDDFDSLYFREEDLSD